MFRPATEVFVLLRGIPSIGRTLKSFILRCLLLWPHLLRNLRRIWSLCSVARPKDLPKNVSPTRPWSPRPPRVCEGYSIIYTSKDPNRNGGPSKSPIPISAEELPLTPVIGQSQSTHHSPAPSLSSLPGSPQRPSSRLSGGSSASFVSSHNANSIHSAQQETIPHLSTPLTLTHSRATSTQFAGAPPNPPSPRSFPFPLSFPFPSPSRSPSPSPSLQSRPLPQSSTLDSSGNIQIPDVVSFPQVTPERSPTSSVTVDITVLPPSRSQTLDVNSTFNSPQSSLSSQQGHVSGPSQSPTSESEYSTQDPLDPRRLQYSHRDAHHSGADPLSGGLTPNSGHSGYGPAFPLPSTSQLTIAITPYVGPSGPWRDGKPRSIGLMHSEQVSRYVNKGDVLPVPSDYRLRPMEVDLPQYSHAKRPKGWTPVTHPGGALYFYHAERRIYTDVYMYDGDLSAQIHSFAGYLDSERERKTREMPFPTDDYDLVLDIINMENDKTIWAYYYVDHKTKTLFWLNFYECDRLLHEVPGAKEASHVKLRLEALYWVHWSLYPAGPNYRRFPNDASNELLGALVSCGIDSLTSKVSTSPYTVEEIRSMRDFIKEAESLGPNNPHIITSVARLLSFYAHWRFMHFHGQKSTRQDRYKSIYKDNRRKRTILFQILSPILFFFPDVHLRELNKLWTDKIVVEALWKEFMEKLVSEWTGFVLYSTVMLTANVSFLAIPGVIVVPQNTWIKPSPAQITSSISLMFSVGSIITGLLLIRRNRMMMTKEPKKAWYYLHGMEWRCAGLEPLAIIFSLTYALLMWSAWGFFVALSIFTFQNTTTTIQISVGTAAGIVSILICWCIGNTWDPGEDEEEPVEEPYGHEPRVETQPQA